MSTNHNNQLLKRYQVPKKKAASNFMNSGFSSGKDWGVFGIWWALLLGDAVLFSNLLMIVILAVLSTVLVITGVIAVTMISDSMMEWWLKCSGQYPKPLDRVKWKKSIISAYEEMEKIDAEMIKVAPEEWGIIGKFERPDIPEIPVKISDTTIGPIADWVKSSLDYQKNIIILPINHPYTDQNTILESINDGAVNTGIAALHLPSEPLDIRAWVESSRLQLPPMNAMWADWNSSIVMYRNYLMNWFITLYPGEDLGKINRRANEYVLKARLKLNVPGDPAFFRHPFLHRPEKKGQVLRIDQFIRRESPDSKDNLYWWSIDIYDQSHFYWMSQYRHYLRCCWKGKRGNPYWTQRDGDTQSYQSESEFVGEYMMFAETDWKQLQESYRSPPLSGTEIRVRNKLEENKAALIKNQQLALAVQEKALASMARIEIGKENQKWNDELLRELLEVRKDK